MVQVSPNHDLWYLSVVYASPQRSKRYMLWKNLETLYHDLQINEFSAK